MTSNRRRQKLLALLGLALLGFAAVGLYVVADPTPTTETSRRLFGLWRARHAALAGCAAALSVGLIAAAVSRPALLSYFSVLLSSTLVFVLLEVAGIAGMVSWPALLSPSVGTLGAIGTRRVPHLDARGHTFQDTAYAWGMPSDPISFHYRTDRHGLRNEPDRAEADVYLLGDSMVVAALVPFEETITSRLERRLERSVMQVALINVSPQREHQLFRETRLDVRGKLVIQFIYEGNDLLDSREYRRRAGDVKAEPWTSRSLASQVWRVLVTATDPTRASNARTTCSISGQRYTFAWTKNSFAGLADEVEIVTTAIQDFGHEVRKGGGYFAVVYVPTKLRVLGSLCDLSDGSEGVDLASNVGPTRDQFLEWSKSSRIEFLDLTEPLQVAANAGRLPWFWGDTHWNALGHDVAANAVAEWIRRLRVED